MLWIVVDLRVWERRKRRRLVLTEECRVSALDGEDGSCGGEVRLVGDVLRSAEVGTDADTFEDIGDGKERWDVGEAKVVRAGRDGLDLGSCQRCQSSIHKVVVDADIPCRALVRNATWVISSWEISLRLL